MSVNGPKGYEAETIEVALMSAKDGTAVTVQIHSGDGGPMSYKDIEEILFKLADDISSTRGDYMTDGTEEIRLC